MNLLQRIRDVLAPPVPVTPLPPPEGVHVMRQAMDDLQASTAELCEQIKRPVPGEGRPSRNAIANTFSHRRESPCPPR